jgi:hypothetical protein
MTQIVVVRLDLDRYDLQMIERLVADGVITLTEARDSRAVRELGDWQAVLWVKRMRYEQVG